MALNFPSTTRIIKPTDEELFQSFLYNKINNNPLPNHIAIIELDLFGTKKNPWEIWEEFATSHSYCGRDLYFFSALKKKSATSSRSVRLIGKGTWEGEDTGTEIFTKDTNQLLGLRKRYRFEKSDTVHDNGWILHEYKLDASLIANPSAENYVLCRFRKNVKKNPVSTRNRIAKNANRRLQRNNTSMGNTGRGRKRKKTVAECEATTISLESN
ncbi:NAC domain-containing protein 83-like [Cicer arietinum]|uniref:NAC domain-containing protein 83-like n=1 Tax=Cicer arietinum TaxID=3827 RepID=UPI003CC64A8D